MSHFPPSVPDFTQPLALLRSCHQKILDHCDLLERLLTQLAEGQVSLEAMTTAQKIYKYFHKGAHEHHQDEEQQLFPALARQSLKLADRVHRAKKEHHQLDQLWTQIGSSVQRPNLISDFKAFVGHCEAYIEAQRAHVLFENEEILDVAQHIFSQKEWLAMGRAMAERRGVQLPLL